MAGGDPGVVLSWFFHIGHLCEHRSPGPRAESCFGPQGAASEQGSPQELPHCGQPHLRGQGSLSWSRLPPQPWGRAVWVHSRCGWPGHCRLCPVSGPGTHSRLHHGPWVSPGPAAGPCRVPHPSATTELGLWATAAAEVPSTQCLSVLQVRLWR